MDHAVASIETWVGQGRSLAWICLAATIALSFVVFNTIRILLYVPQLRTCLKDTKGCQAINLWTWSSWIVANSSTAGYMWLFLHDTWGALLNAGNAMMCLAVVLVTLTQRRRWRLGLPALEEPPVAAPAAANPSGEAWIAPMKFAALFVAALMVARPAHGQRLERPAQPVAEPSPEPPPSQRV